MFECKVVHEELKFEQQRSYRALIAKPYKESIAANKRDVISSIDPIPFTATNLLCS